MISCGHCGGQHSTVTAVRTCSLNAYPTGLEPTSPTPQNATGRPTRAIANNVSNRLEPVALEPDWQRLAGPSMLGRNLVVNPGQTAPEPWTECERIVIDGQPDALNCLQALRKTRTRAVIELQVDLSDDDTVLEVPYWHLSPNTDLADESLRHLVFDHSVDARVPDQPTIRAVSQALSAGAGQLTQNLGDVETNDGSAWCDGGPLEWFDNSELGAAVIPAVHLSIGSLATIRNITPNADLAADQLRAVAHSGGGARIIAPAGSGKTRVLTERARHLIRDRKIDPATVCLIAFNVRARQEMQARTTDLTGLQIRTLNSLALAILSGSGPFRSPANRSTPRVIDEHEVRQILDGLVARRRKAMTDPLAVWLEALTATRLGLRAPSAVEQEFGGDILGFADVVPQLRAHLADAGVVDFDEQILGAIEVLCIDPAARAAARRVCGVLLVDEFQDLTPAHILLIRLLAGPAANVFGVGDDDQTIYGYSGASPSWLIDFADLFPGAAAHDLQVNYRCPSSVVDAAATLLTHNRHRINKTIKSRSERATLDNEITILVSDDPLNDTIARVSELVDKNIPLSSIAVLARVNATLLGPMILLEEAGFPTNSPVRSSFMERTGIAGALAWLCLAVAPENSLPSDELETAILRPPRGISRRLAGWVGEQRSPRQLKALAGRLKQERDQLKVSEFNNQLAALRDLAERDADTARLLVAIRDKIGLGLALDNRLDASRRSVDRSAHGDDLAALLAVATHCKDPAAFPGWLAKRLKETRTDPSGITLSTIHRVKGREWPHVLVHDASNGLMPHRLSSDIEEERRVFHVAITRAVESVTITASHPASPFITAMHTPRQPEPHPQDPITLSTQSKPTATQAQRRNPVDPPVASTIDETRLRERLKTWRSATAKAAGVPAYVVFNDATLYQIAALRPQNDDDLLSISGIGPVKLERYGEDVFAIVNGIDDD